MLSDSAIHALRAARAAEKEQALFYRALSVEAENRQLLMDIEALNGLLADEQHHLSRITVRLVELGYEPGELNVRTPECEFNGWRDAAQIREREEVARYEGILALPLDDETRIAITNILEVERAHAAHLGGKYTDA